MNSVSDGLGVEPFGMVRNTTSLVTPRSYSALVVHSPSRAPAILGCVSSLIQNSKYPEELGVYKYSTDEGPEKTKRLGWAENDLRCWFGCRWSWQDRICAGGYRRKSMEEEALYLTRFDVADGIATKSDKEASDLILVCNSCVTLYRRCSGLY